MIAYYQNTESEMELTYPYIFVFSFLIIAGFFFSLPFFKYIDSNGYDKVSHNIPLDSLRYFLASFVFIAHSIGIYDYILHGMFRGKYAEIDLLARSGVALFFAITGMLFWGKIKEVILTGLLYIQIGFLESSR